MLIAGFKESSLNEWEGHIASVIWTAGCNWKCAYCHASHLIKELDKIKNIEEQTVFDYIKGKSGWIDGLCISGGEPTLQPDLEDFIQRAKNELEGIAIKLETNGSNPVVIKRLLKNNLLGCLCLDFKQLPQRVLEVNGQSGGIFEIVDSYSAAFRSDIEVEFHTTLCPAFIDLPSIKPMGEFLHNKGLWVLQQYDPSETLIPDKAGNVVYSEEEVVEIYREAQHYHNNVILKNAYL